jgi:hypothetical protein
MRFTLTNKTKKAMKVAEPLALLGLVKIRVTTAGGKQVDAPKRIWDIMLPPKDYGIELGPGKTLERSWSLNESYPFGLNPGFYGVECMYDTETLAASFPLVWHGKIQGPPLEFGVQPPTETEKEALHLFESARNIMALFRADEYPKARKLLSDLVEKFPESVYAPYSSYLLAKSCFVMQADKTQHFAEAVGKYGDFLRKFGGYAYYSDRVQTTELPTSLSQTGRYDDARTILANAPDGHFKNLTIGHIKKMAALETGAQPSQRNTWSTVLAAMAGIGVLCLTIFLLRRKAISRTK